MSVSSIAGGKGSGGLTVLIGGGGEAAELAAKKGKLGLRLEAAEEKTICAALSLIEKKSRLKRGERGNRGTCLTEYSF